MELNVCMYVPMYVHIYLCMYERREKKSETGIELVKILFDICWRMYFM